jgi:hypothetical protein
MVTGNSCVMADFLREIDWLFWPSPSGLAAPHCLANLETLELRMV